MWMRQRQTALQAWEGDGSEEEDEDDDFLETGEIPVAMGSRYNDAKETDKLVVAPVGKKPNEVKSKFKELLAKNTKK